MKKHITKLIAQSISLYPYNDGVVRLLGNCASQDELNELKQYFLGMSDKLNID